MVRFYYRHVRSAIVDQSELESLVISVVEEIQELSGRKCLDISRTTCPLMELDDFDSLNAVEATVVFEEKLGIKVATNNLFVAEDGKTALNIAGIAQRLSKQLKAEQPA